MSSHLHPAVQNERLRTSVIGLISGIRDHGGLSPARIREAMGVDVQQNPDGEYGIYGTVDDRWDYNLISIHDAPGSDANGLMFSFDMKDPGSTESSIPGFDPEAFRSELNAEGFSFEPILGQHGQVEFWLFERAGVVVQAFLRGRNRDAPTPTCVSKILVSLN
jgi:hypothetical protein